MKRFFGKAAVAAALVVSAVAQPAAAQVLGKLNIVGTVDIFQTMAGPAENVVIDFKPAAGGGSGTVNSFLSNTGIFAPIPFLTPGTNIDFVLGGGAAPPATVLPTPILTIAGYTFTATSFGAGNIPGYPFSLTESGGTVFATLSVSGTVTGPGILGVAGFVGGYSTQFPGMTIDQLLTQVGAGPAGIILDSSASASFIVSAVPEPATVALMGTGLVALFGVGLRRRNTV